SSDLSNGLNRTVSFKHDGAARGFIAAAGFHTHITIFDDIQTTNTVFATQLVQIRQNSGWRQALTIDGYDIAFIVSEVNIGSFVWCSFSRNTPAPHFFFSFGQCIFKNTTFLCNMRTFSLWKKPPECYFSRSKPSAFHARSGPIRARVQSL